MRILEIKENKIRGSADFPIELYHIHKHHPRYVMPLHWHDELEIIKIIKGRLHYKIGTRSGTANPDDILYINSGILHEGLPENCDYFCIVFDLSFFAKSGTASDKMLLPFINGDTDVLLNLSDINDKQLNLIIRNLCDFLLEGRERNELQIHGLLYQLYGNIIQNRYYDVKTEPPPVKKNILQLKRTLSVIENKYNNPLSLQTLAEEANMSPKYFCYFFKQMTHFTPIEYLNRYRINIACYHLMTGQRNITEIAFDCGFNELSYFIRVFKKIMGITPKQYCKINKKG